MCGGRKPASLDATGGPAAAQTIEGGCRPGCPGMRNMIAAFDRAAVRRIGETDSRLLDLVMPRLSRLANRRAGRRRPGLLGQADLLRRHALAGPPRDRRLPLPGAARGRLAHPLRPPHLPAHRLRLAVGRPDRRRLPPPARRLRLTSPYRVLTITGRRQPAHQHRRCPRRGNIPALATARTQTAPAHSHPPTRNQDQIRRAAGGSEAA